MSTEEKRTQIQRKKHHLEHANDIHVLSRDLRAYTRKEASSTDVSTQVRTSTASQKEHC